jgi:hypothetical protein
MDYLDNAFKQFETREYINARASLNSIEPQIVQTLRGLVNTQATILLLLQSQVEWSCPYHEDLQECNYLGCTSHTKKMLRI